jgi:Uma2 family endonuclease
MTFEQAMTERLPLKLTVDEFLTLDETGVFDRYSKTELIDGVIYVVNAQHSPHMMLKTKLLLRLAAACERVGLEAWAEGAVDMSPDSLPEPDLIVTKTRPDEGAVKLETVALLCEVADSTLSSDLQQKAALYARKGVPEYWVADVRGRTLYQLWLPGPNGYGERRAIPFGQGVESATVPGLAIETDALL